MRQRRLEWGSGPRTVVLVHGYTDDADTWWRVGPALAELGWHVVAPDLRGHGLSPHSQVQSVEMLLEDLVDSIDPGAELVVGHSLGAALVNLVDLGSQRVMLVDPPWGPLPPAPTRLPGERSVEEIRRLEPRWSDGDLQVDLRSNLRLDPAITAWIGGSDPLSSRAIPFPPLAPTTLVLPAAGGLTPPSRYDELTSLGFGIVTVPRVGHVIHRDDLDAFVRVVHSDGQPGVSVVPRGSVGRSSVSPMYTTVEL
jgi:pimeloyl-ACP methyl ester carboxylesterase